MLSDNPYKLRIRDKWGRAISDSGESDCMEVPGRDAVVKKDVIGANGTNGRGGWNTHLRAEFKSLYYLIYNI